MRTFFHHREISQDIKEEIIRRNNRIVFVISSLVTGLESVMLIMFSISNRANLFGSKLESFISVLICIIASAITSLYFGNVRKKQYLNQTHDKRDYGMMLIYFIVLSIWGMFASRRHYVVGDQILTFYIVEIAFVSFVIFNPFVSGILLIGMFGLFYGMLYGTN